MTFEIPAHIEDRIQRYMATHPGETPQDVLEKALDKLENANPTSTGEDFIETYRQFRGMTKGWRYKEMLNDGREGLQ